jgi:riboflavin synthase
MGRATAPLVAYPDGASKDGGQPPPGYTTARMFTGLIQDMGNITAAETRGGPMRLTVEPLTLRTGDLVHGESIAVSGPCLTVVETTARTVSFDVGAETLARTTAGAWRPGRRVNLERALALGDRLGGHLVAGHVDGVGEVRERREADGVLHLGIGLPEAIAPLVCEKGSISVDGVSLTVNAATRDAFRVTLIPETLARTTLAALQVGDPVNLEADILARHLARMLAFAGAGKEGKSALDLEFLARHGYL